MVCNLDILTHAAASSGFVHVLPDPDGLIRRIPLLMQRDQEVLPSFVLAMLAQAEHRNQVIWRNDSASGFLLRLADIDIPVDAASQLGIRYRNTAHRIPHISAADILSDGVNPDVISGKRVFVGTTAAGLMDTIATPVDPVFSGVELHATVAENILSRYFWTRPAWVRLLEMVVLVAIVLVTGLLVGRKGILWGGSATILLIVLLRIGSSWAMERHGLYVSPLFPMLSAGCSFVGFMSIRFVRESYWKTYFQSAFVKTAIQAQRFRSDKEAADLASRHKSDFLAHMSHEIRTPMNAILGIAEVLSETDLDAQQRQYLQTLYQSGEILLDIINDILDLSKIEAGRIRLETIAFDLRKLFLDTVEVMRVRAWQKGVPILLDIDPGVPLIWMGDPTRVRQILVNLIGNAIKFTDTGNIRVNVSPRNPENRNAGFLVQVADTGIGIAPEKRDEIFSPFSQEDVSTTRKYGGTGLGLTICRRLAELMGGSIRVESELGQGSTFIVDLPLQVGHEASLDGATDLKAEVHGFGKSSKGKVSLSGLRVLLAEDVAVNRRVVELYLKDTGLELHSVENGKEALDRHRAETYDVILMDMEMPVMDGLEATAAIREWEAEEARHAVPIVALTAHAFEEKRQQCFEAGCTHYLTKPVKKADLIDLLHRIYQDTDRLHRSENISTENPS
jgi:signal transduction histidine kinase/AmiR/NasT family two-component response regulator